MPFAVHLRSKARRGGAVAPTLATKATAYSPTGEVGTNNGLLRNATGWAMIPGSGGSPGGAWDTWRTYTGGLIGSTGGFGSSTPGLAGWGVDTLSTNHVFRVTISAATGGALQMIVAGSSMSNCVWVDIGAFNSGTTGANSISAYKIDATGKVQLNGGSGVNYNNPQEVGRDDKFGGNSRILKLGDVLEAQVLGQKLHIFVNGKRVTAQGGWDLDETRPFTKGTLVGLGDWSTDASLRLSNPYAAPLVTALGLQATSQYLTTPSFAPFWGGVIGTGRAIPINGTWQGTKPTALRYRVVNETTGALIQDWAWVSTATINDDGTWTANCLVPMSDMTTNPRMRVQVGSYGDADACTMTPRGAAVGYLILVYGQSNANGWGGASATTYTPNQHSYGWDATNGWAGGDVLDTQVKSRKLGDVLAPLLGIPVGVFRFGPASHHIYELNHSDGSVTGDWSNEYYIANDPLDVAFFDNLIAFLNDYRVAGYGYVQETIWVQGEAETQDASMSESDYIGYFNTLLSNLHSGVMTSSTGPVNVCVIGSYTGVGADVGQNGFYISRVRGWLARLKSIANVYHAANLIDLALADGLHYTPDAVVEEARRVGHSIAARKGFSTYDGRGPIVTSVARSGLTITLSLNLNGSTGLAAASGLTFYEVNTASDWSGTSYTVSTAAVSGNTIVLGLASAPAGAVYVRSFWRADNLTGAVYAKGNYSDSTQLPVEPIYTPLLST